jgi:hypothetical protein
MHTLSDQVLFVLTTLGRFIDWDNAACTNMADVRIEALNVSGTTTYGSTYIRVVYSPDLRKLVFARRGMHLDI